MLSTAPRKHHGADTLDAVTTIGLDDRRCLVPSLVAWPVSALVRARRYFEVADTQVLVLPHRALAAATAAAQLAAARLAGPVTVRGWLAEPGGEAVEAGPSLYNLGTDCVEEAVVELAALAGRTADAGRYDRLVIACQQFVPARVSARVRVCAASGAVTIRSCWGLDECLETVFDHDLLDVSLPSMGVRSQLVAAKPTAVYPADGGTRVAPVEPERRREATIGRGLGRRLAVACWSLTRQYRRDAEFDIAIVDDTPFLLTCRPVTVA